jgi:hypothetical protein
MTVSLTHPDTSQAVKFYLTERKGKCKPEWTMRRLHTSFSLAQIVLGVTNSFGCLEGVAVLKEVDIKGKNVHISHILCLTAETMLCFLREKQRLFSDYTLTAYRNNIFKLYTPQQIERFICMLEKKNNLISA